MKYLSLTSFNNKSVHTKMYHIWHFQIRSVYTQFNIRINSLIDFLQHQIFLDDSATISNHLNHIPETFRSPKSKQVPTIDAERSIMNGVSSAKLKMYDGEDDNSIMIKKPLPLRAVSWNDTIEETDLDVPGTPRTPRTSTTKGTAFRHIGKY